MAKKRQTSENYEGAFCDDIDFEDIDSPQGDIYLTIGRHARTFSLPLEDIIYGKLLNMDKQGQATILNKVACPCPKEGVILVMCEYDINF